MKVYDNIFMNFTGFYYDSTIEGPQYSSTGSSVTVKFTFFNCDSTVDANQYPRKFSDSVAFKYTCFYRDSAVDGYKYTIFTGNITEGCIDNLRSSTFRLSTFKP